MANFWTSNNVEPKRNFRFQVQFTGLSADGDTTSDILWWAKTVTTPAFDVSEVEHNYLDNKFYFPGRVSWNEVSLTLVDPISVDAVSQTNKLLEAQGYKVPANEGMVETMSKNKGTVALGNVLITIFGAEGNIVEQWLLNNPFIKSAKFGDLDYSSDDLRTVEITVRYDWATCDTGGNDKSPNGLAKKYFEPQS
jgi:hypothetical protein